ncbi:acyl-CoA thioesterase [Marinomonas sp. 15G1-11]|uniref:Acyl-CoA thioesterase n=1 Tax=Marinomonas phaeophyticola TaxID=3004091 RepID=A0ABT4JPY0_9GAMM|nr:acyl-CoA thioesterase [Marinomonas sp. 15G1-11]MCZ2720285.1 acyl-CoA thioesterase [Marinomonas sp. 15G1-11]
MVEQHITNFEVRDYECDIQGIVNNSVYQNYLEHARHKFLKSKGINFTELAKNNINLVVIRAELDYKSPLISQDEFIISTHMVKTSKIKFAFHQTITRLSDNALILQAIVTGTSINEKGKPIRFSDLDDLV